MRCRRLNLAAVQCAGAELRSKQSWDQYWRGLQVGLIGGIVFPAFQAALLEQLHAADLHEQQDANVQAYR